MLHVTHVATRRRRHWQNGPRFDTVRIAQTQHAEPFGFLSDPLNEERSFPRVFVPPMRGRGRCSRESRAARRAKAQPDRAGGGHGSGSAALLETGHTSWADKENGGQGQGHSISTNIEYSSVQVKSSEQLQTSHTSAKRDKHHGSSLCSTTTARPLHHHCTGGVGGGLAIKLSRRESAKVPRGEADPSGDGQHGRNANTHRGAAHEGDPASTSREAIGACGRRAQVKTRLVQQPLRERAYPLQRGAVTFLGPARMNTTLESTGY